MTKTERMMTSGTNKGNLTVFYRMMKKPKDNSANKMFLGTCNTLQEMTKPLTIGAFNLVALACSAKNHSVKVCMNVFTQETNNLQLYSYETAQDQQNKIKV